MKKVVFVSIDRPARWSQWNSGYTDKVYYSNFLDTEEDVSEFVEQLKKDYPDSNFIDGGAGHEYFVRYVSLDYDENNEEGFKTLKRMMRAYNLYKTD